MGRPSCKLLLMPAPPSHQRCLSKQNVNVQDTKPPTARHWWWNNFPVKWKPRSSDHVLHWCSAFDTPGLAWILTFNPPFVVKPNSTLGMSVASSQFLSEHRHVGTYITTTRYAVWCRQGVQQRAPGSGLCWLEWKPDSATWQMVILAKWLISLCLHFLIFKRLRIPSSSQGLT